MKDSDIKIKMDKVLSLLNENLRKLRTGRANVSLIESIKVEVYNTTMPLSQIATISALDFKTLNIQPWDKSNSEPIMKSINASNLGMTPVQDGDIIRISVPELTEERRKELIKVVGSYEEESKIHLRQIRKDLIDIVKKDEESTEDDIKSFIEEVDKNIKKYNEEIAGLCDAKRVDMMKV